jgi:hypothetical protein
MSKELNYRLNVELDGLPCEVYFKLSNLELEVYSINVIGDCTISLNDLSEDQKSLLLQKIAILLNHSKNLSFVKTKTDT